MNLNQFGETVRLGVLGLGCRGYSQLKVLLDMPDVEITAVSEPGKGTLFRIRMYKTVI